MIEAALPLLGTAIMFGLILPAAALVARALLWLLSPRGAELHEQGALRYALLVGATAVPLGWFISASLHQAEAGTATGVCVVPEPPGVLCPEVGVFAAILVVLVALTALPRLIREQRALRCSTSQDSLRALGRLRVLLQERGGSLVSMLTRLVVIDDAQEPIATRGVFRPRIVIAASFANQLDDDALLAALNHEAEHVRHWDPLRYFLAWWALSVNPIGKWLLGPELRRWIFTREAHCDRDAVLSGASAPALAQALVAAARFPAARACPALRASDADVLRLRVGLLMAYADRHPRRWRHAPALRTALCGLLLALVLPHHIDDGALDALHRAAETAASLITGE